MNLHVGVSPLNSPVMTQVISSQKESWEENDLIIKDLAGDSNHKSDFLICYKSWQISDFAYKNSNDTVREQIPSPVNVVHYVGKADTELWLSEFCNHHD